MIVELKWFIFGIWKKLVQIKHFCFRFVSKQESWYGTVRYNLYLRTEGNLRMTETWRWFLIAKAPVTELAFVHIPIVTQFLFSFWFFYIVLPTRRTSIFVAFPKSITAEWRHWVSNTKHKEHLLRAQCLNHSVASI